MSQVGGAGLPREAKLVLFAAGIYSAYLTQGYVQEALSTTTYEGPDGPERFPHLEALNGAQCLACFLVAGVLLLLTGGGGGSGGRKSNNGSKKKAMEIAPRLAYWKPAVTNTVGPACGIIALKSISYPAQVLAKSSKAIPVMIMGTLIGGKTYSVVEYLSTVLIAAGISLFAYKGSSKVSAKLAAPNATLGYGLCFINLALDGFTNATQEQIHNRYADTTALHTMCYMNMWSSLYFLTYLFGPVHLLGLKANVGAECVSFCSRHPGAALQVLLFCLCGAWGQIFIFQSLRTFGALLCTLVTTTRKFFNILISVALNGNPLLPQQWAAVAMVFAGLAMHSLFKRKGKKEAPPPGKAANGKAL